MKTKLKDLLTIPFFFSPGGLDPHLFENKDLCQLSLSSKLVHSLTQPELDKRRCTMSRKLVTHVIFGEQNEAKCIINAYPNLLLEKARATDHIGRNIVATPFQAALGAGDTPMWEMILTYFEKLNQFEEAYKQYQEWFPNGVCDDITTFELKRDFYKIAFEISHKYPNLDEALGNFRKNIDSQQEIRKGKFFNIEYLIAAHHVFYDFFNITGAGDKANLYWKNVIGYVQRQLPVYDLQVLCSGINSVLTHSGNFKRTFNSDNQLSTEKLFPLENNSGLGFQFALHSNDATNNTITPQFLGNALTASLSHVSMIQYAQQKKEYLKGLEEFLTDKLNNVSSKCSLL